MRKIFSIVLCLFIILTVFTIPTLSKKNTLRTNLELEKIEITPTSKVYLLNQNDYFVEVGVILPKKDIIEEMIEILKEESTNKNLKGYLPKTLKIIDYEIKEKLLVLNLSEEINEKYIPGLVHSLLMNLSVEKIQLLINGNPIKSYEEPIDKLIPLNREVQIKNRAEIEKVTVYYVDDLEKNYLVPVTKYLNQKEEKIEIILEELKYHIPNNLISYVDCSLELLDYEIENDYIVLNFNQKLLIDKETKEKIIQEIKSSIFDNYDVSSLLIKVNGKLEQIATRNR